jgi:hypothetical protein
VSVEPIEGKVAQVLSTRELVINRGSADGVTTGMEFEVLDPAGNDIRDPDTLEVIGSVHRPKLPVKVYLVQEKLSVARTYRRRPPRGFTIPNLLVGSAGGPETFKTRDASWQPITEEESFVKVGDPVREIVVPDEAIEPGEVPPQLPAPQPAADEES